MRAVTRRMALMMVAHARRLLPHDHEFWGEAMENEALHIPDDGAALRWALGCVFASYRMRMAGATETLVRAFLVLLILFFCYENLVGPVQAIGCYAHIDLLASLPDDRIICISWPAVPLGMQCLSLTAAILFAASGLQLLLKRRTAFHFFVLGFAAGLTAFIFEQGLPALAVYRTSTLFGRVLEHVAVHQAIVPMLVAAAVWLATVRTGEFRQQAG